MDGRLRIIRPKNTGRRSSCCKMVAVDVGEIEDALWKINETLEAIRIELEQMRKTIPSR